jgi:hypothetical protein
MRGRAHLHCMPSEKKRIQESTEEGSEILQECACSSSQKQVSVDLFISEPHWEAASSQDSDLQSLKLLLAQSLCSYLAASTRRRDGINGSGSEELWTHPPRRRWVADSRPEDAQLRRLVVLNGFLTHMPLIKIYEPCYQQGHVFKADVIGKVMFHVGTMFCYTNGCTSRPRVGDKSQLGNGEERCSDWWSRNWGKYRIIFSLFWLYSWENRPKSLWL